VTGAPRNRLSWLGLSFAAAYALIAVAVYWLIASSAEQDPLGYQWIPFISLGWPWYFLVPNGGLGLVAGVAVNVGIFYLLGWSIQKLLQRIFSARRQTTRNSME